MDGSNPRPERHRARTKGVRRHAAIALVLAVAVALGGSIAGAGEQQQARDPGWPKGLIRNEAGALPGYTLFSPLTLESTFLVDLDGRVVHTWNTTRSPACTSTSPRTASLLRAGNLKRQGFRAAQGWGGTSSARLGRST